MARRVWHAIRNRHDVSVMGPGELYWWPEQKNKPWAEPEAVCRCRCGALFTLTPPPGADDGGR